MHFFPRSNKTNLIFAILLAPSFLPTLLIWANTCRIYLLFAIAALATIVIECTKPGCCIHNERKCYWEDAELFCRTIDRWITSREMHGINSIHGWHTVQNYIQANLNGPLSEANNINTNTNNGLPSRSENSENHISIFH